MVQSNMKMFLNPHKYLTLSHLFVKLKLKEVNKLIQKWSVQLAHKFEPKRLKNNEWFCLTEKLNGVRGTFCKGKIYSRQGKEICGLEHILKAIEGLNLPNIVFDGELIRDNVDGISDNENFRIGTGIIQKAWIGNRREATAMASASAFKRKFDALEIELDKSKQFATIKFCKIKTKRKFSWHKLRNYCTSHELETRKIFDANYTEINSYPAEAWKNVYGLDIENLAKKEIRRS
jgi:hypothetical protein